MKRTFYTLALVAFFGLMSNAQSAEPAKVKKETVKDDGTLAPAKATLSQQDDGSVQKIEPQAEQKPAPSTRMAITEKGVPASKSTEQKPKATEQKKAEPAKSEKH